MLLVGVAVVGASGSAGFFPLGAGQVVTEETRPGLRGSGRTHRWACRTTVRTGKPIPHPAPERLEDASASPIPPVLADVAINKHPKEMRDRRLIRALVRSRGRRDDANVEEESEGRGGDGNGRDGLIDIPQVSRHPITEKWERDLEHDGGGAPS